ncbi:MAG: hypothetical protein GY725_10120, partial [bacterium]|nr:hypothetical protein [bacterium]
ADPVSPLLSPELIFGLMFLALASYLEILRDLGAFIREGRAFFVDARRFLKSQTAEASLSEDPKEKTP